LGAELFGFLLQLIEPPLAPGGEHQACSLLRQGTRAGLSDAGAGARDQSHFSTEVCRHIFILLFSFLLVVRFEPPPDFR
jgi:hypothetical protein